MELSAFRKQIKAIHFIRPEEKKAHADEKECKSYNAIFTVHGLCISYNTKSLSNELYLPNIGLTCEPSSANALPGHHRVNIAVIYAFTSASQVEAFVS
jgi:hypothetical protein